MAIIIKKINMELFHIIHYFAFSGLDYLNITHLNFDLFNLESTLSTMNYDTFCKMFKYQMYFPEIINKTQIEPDLEVLLTEENQKYIKFLYRSCFENSMWYYPGQLYPELTLSVSDEDLISRGTLFYNFNSHNDKFPQKIFDSKFQNPEYYSNEHFNKEGQEKQFSINLSDLVEYQKTDIKQKIKIVIVSACRPIERQIKAPLFRLEVLTYHMNQSMIKTNQKI